MWQSKSKTVFSKFVLYSDCVYVVLPTCVEVVNATVLNTCYVLKVDMQFILCEFILSF